MQRFRKRNQINGLLALAEGDHLVEDPAVLLQEEILRLQALDSGVERMVVEQNGSEDGAFRVQVVRERPFERGSSGHRADLFFAFSSLYNILRRGAQVRSVPCVILILAVRTSLLIVSVSTRNVNPSAVQIFAERCKSVEKFYGKLCGMIRRSKKSFLEEIMQRKIFRSSFLGRALAVALS